MAALSPQQVRRVYDRIGRLQDLQGYERRAVDDLVAHGAFERAAFVVELGCGTGVLAARLLAERLPPSARYLGLDLSPRMVALARRRLAPYGARAEARLADDGPPLLPVDDGACDRVVAAYVLDLLAPEAAAAFVADARRALAPGGRLCLVSIAPGERGLPRLVSAAWTRLWRTGPALVGGCRPIRLAPLLEGWRIEHRRLAAQLGVTSEIVVAERR